MCGIIAYSGNVKFNPDKIKLLFMYNESRGKQASGFYINDEKKEFKERVVKSLGPSSEKLLPLYSLDPSTVLIGHTRQSSVGSSTDINNVHPFVQNELVGVHNGTFDNYADVKKAFNVPATECLVDSLLFYKLLSDNKEDFYETYSYFKGKAALVWSNSTSPNVLKVFRNKERPLYRGAIKNGDDIGIYISSLEEALLAIGCTNIQEFKEDKLYTITDGVVVASNKSIYTQALPKVEEPVLTNEDNTTVLFTLDRTILANELVPNESYIRKYMYSDKSISVDTQYNGRHSEDKEYEIIYCNNRKEYFYRVYYGFAINPKNKYMEYLLPKKLLAMGSSLSVDSLPDIVLPDLEPVANLLYDFWGRLSYFQMQASAEMEKQGITLDMKEVQIIMDKMEKFLNIAAE